MVTLVSGWAASAFAAFIALGVAQQASAATVKITYTGEVEASPGQTQVLDQTGIFGAPGGNLEGLDYNLVFTVDSNVGNYSTFSGTFADPLLSGDQIFGGITADLTINGHNYSFTGIGSPTGNFDIVAHEPGLGEVVQQFSLPDEFVSIGLEDTNPSPQFPTSVYTAFALSACPAASCSFSGTFYIPTATTALNGSLDFGTVSAAISPAVTPIPATLPLLVSGLSGLGFVVWRRKKIEAA